MGHAISGEELTFFDECTLERLQALDKDALLNDFFAVQKVRGHCAKAEAKLTELKDSEAALGQALEWYGTDSAKRRFQNHQDKLALSIRLANLQLAIIEDLKSSPIQDVEDECNHVRGNLDVPADSACVDLAWSLSA